MAEPPLRAGGETHRHCGIAEKRAVNGEDIITARYTDGGACACQHDVSARLEAEFNGWRSRRLQWLYDDGGWRGIGRGRAVSESDM